jgi:hypothetical protein
MLAKSLSASNSDDHKPQSVTGKSRVYGVDSQLLADLATLSFRKRSAVQSLAGLPRLFDSNRWFAG